MSKQSFNKRAKENFKLGASTLVNNQACIEMGRTRPWYSAVIAGLVAVVIAVIPLLSSQLSLKASSLLDSPNYDLDNGLITFVNELNTKDVSMKIDSETREMTVTNWDAMTTSEDPYYVDSDAFLRVYWLPSIDETTLSSYLDDNTSSFEFNYLIFFKNGFVLSKYTGSSTSAVQGQYDRLTVDFDIKDFAKQNTYNEAYSVTKTDADADVTKLNEYHSNVITAWKTFLNDSFKTQRLSNAWTWTGIMCAVFAGLIFFMGLMIFLMCRGKNNPYRIYTFWETQKIAYWAAPAPAVVGLLLGFMMSSMAMMGFIFAYGLRVMWLASKSLRPYQQ